MFSSCVLVRLIFFVPPLFRVHSSLLPRVPKAIVWMDASTLSYMAGTCTCLKAPSGPDPAQLLVPLEHGVHHVSDDVDLLFLFGAHLLDQRRGRPVPDGLPSRASHACTRTKRERRKTRRASRVWRGGQGTWLSVQRGRGLHKQPRGVIPPATVCREGRADQHLGLRRHAYREPDEHNCVLYRGRGWGRVATSKSCPERLVQ